MYPTNASPTRMALAVFFGSLVANAGFFIYTKHLEHQVRIADYNDRSWTVYESFDEFDKKFEAAQQEQLLALTRESTLFPGPVWIKPVGGFHRLFMGDSSSFLGEVGIYFTQVTTTDCGPVYEAPRPRKI